MRRVIAYFMMLVILLLGWYILHLKLFHPEAKPSLDTPSPALGQMVANAVHRAVTDPYFRSLEKLADFLRHNPETNAIQLDDLTRWSLDDQFPTNFVWEVESGRLEIDQASSPWVLETMVEMLRRSLQVDNPDGYLYTKLFNEDNEQHWLGFLRVPNGSGYPHQLAGVFFSIDKYLEEDVPRLVDELVNDTRFPLASFQLAQAPMQGERDGDISFRILTADSAIYLQRGRIFDPAHMIYAESRYYDNPIVVLQEGWDLQVFSTKAAPIHDFSQDKMFLGIIILVIAILFSAAFWWGSGMQRSGESADKK